MAAKAMIVGKDAILSWFDNNINEDKPMFSVWMGSNILYSSVVEDLEQAREKLELNLDSSIHNNFSEILTLKIHQNLPKFENNHFITNKTPVTATVTFRPVELKGYDAMLPVEQQGQNLMQYKMLETLNGINARLEALEDGEDEDDEPMGAIPIQQPKPDVYTVLNMFLQNERVQDAVIGKVLGFLGVQQQPLQQQQQQIAGIPSNVDEDEKLFLAINILKRIRPQVVEDLVNLAHIAEQDPNKANMILSMLPK
jgi:hypothetical protein